MENLKSQEQLKKELYAPLPKEAIKPHPTKTYLSSIKAIYVTERLNSVFGIGQWQTKVDVIDKGERGMIVVKTTFTVPDYNIYYECFGGNDNGGEGSKNFDLGDAYKGATTDAITKIGSYLGVGIDVFKGNIAKKIEEPPMADRVNNMLGKKPPIDSIKSYKEKINAITTELGLTKFYNELPNELKSNEDLILAFKEQKKTLTEKL